MVDSLIWLLLPYCSYKGKTICFFDNFLLLLVNHDGFPRLIGKFFQFFLPLCMTCNHFVAMEWNNNVSLATTLLWSSSRSPANATCYGRSWELIKQIWKQPWRPQSKCSYYRRSRATPRRSSSLAVVTNVKTTEKKLVNSVMILDRKWRS